MPFSNSRIRFLSLAVVLSEEKFLFSQVYDSNKEIFFLRPFGGEVEFGESSQSGVIREFEEELCTSISIIRRIGVYENIFHFEGEIGHEISTVYLAKSGRSRISIETENSSAVWIEKNHLPNENIFPDGLYDDLKNDF